MRKIENKLPDLTENELRLIRKYTKSIINQMMHDPLLCALKRWLPSVVPRKRSICLLRFLLWKIISIKKRILIL